MRFLCQANAGGGVMQTAYKNGARLKRVPYHVTAKDKKMKEAGIKNEIYSFLHA